MAKALRGDYSNFWLQYLIVKNTFVTVIGSVLEMDTVLKYV